MTEQPLRDLHDSEDEDAKVADLMSPALGVFRPDMTVADTVEALRELTRSAMITYCYVTEEDGRLVGVTEVGGWPRMLRHVVRGDPRCEVNPVEVARCSGPAALDEAARQRATRLLGHNRSQISNCYLGSDAALRRR